MLCKYFFIFLLVIFLGACSSEESQEAEIDVAEFVPTDVSRGTEGIPALKWVAHGETYNPEAPIPSQCYTKTDGRHNPCYVCHQSYPLGEERVNSLNDGFLQGSYIFSDHGVNNSWVNLFKDRRAYIEGVSDDFMNDYVSQDNYSELVAWMQSDQWQGETPNIENLHLGAEAFEDNGLAKDGSRWVAFNYKPLPSTFWPTNGATDDVMIRLAPKFSEINGEYSEDVYFANLSLLEMAIKDIQEISAPPINEAIVDVDLDGDTVISLQTERLLRRATFLGDASDVPLTTMLYPEGTEFLHTVRYLGVEDGKIRPSARMKEVRYLKKNRFINPKKIAGVNYAEAKEKHFEKLPLVSDYGDEGMGNRHGWVLWGFIEDENGTLRKQHYEEQFFCIGCHKSVGANIDQTFSFPRKVAGSQGWGYIDLEQIIDVPNIGESEGEFLTYLQRVGGGDEFRQNTEMIERWFNDDGSVKVEEVKALDNIYELITPSTERAMALNKAYHAIVKEQSYLYGRDTTIAPATNVFKQVDREDPPLEREFRYSWDMRLDWTAAERF